MKKRLISGIIHRLPQNSMSRTMGKIMATRFSRLAIRHYIRMYNIDLSQVEKPVHEYRSLKDFFIRRLKPGARPIDADKKVIVSPVDGTVSQLGDIHEGTLIQAKGKNYKVSELLGNDPDTAKRFVGGSFITIYLSPRDYHRIHAPVEGTLTKYSYLPGRLYPVNQMGVENVESLFARNERLITFIRNEQLGCVAVIKVGALFVGSVKVAYNRATTNVRGGRQITEEILGTPQVSKGDELGWFEFGSTVILLFEKDQIEWTAQVREGATLRMGQKLAVQK
ncbi:archaetidylserine decarboxylase [Brevibacillus sp. SYSU BS000544]|uniref:archaetidylserine decarboxylase n=1 Tax=Brevibacillus sp. SYSU BS000544 TaxID=3416443 RepID=UPI003CE4E37D